MFWAIKRTDKKRKTTGVKPGGGLEEEKYIFFTLKEARLEKQSKAEMFDSAAHGVIIVQTHTLRFSFLWSL